MQDLVGTALRVNALLAHVARGIDQQAHGVARTSGSVQALDQATQRDVALIEASAAAAGSLNDQALALAQRVGRFQLEAAA
jgi:methyl-accepting chemotaxis protein